MVSSDKQTRPLESSYFFTDDLCAFNDDEFENNYNDIYPNELEVKKEKEYPCKVLFEPFSRSS